MEEQPAVMQPAPAADEVKPMSFSEKLVNIFAAPGELFENVRLTGKTPSNWIIPVAIMIVVAIAMQQLIMSNPSLLDQTKAMITKATNESFDKAVREGKMTPEQAERMAKQLLAERAERLGIGEYAGEAEQTYSEVFNMIRGWSTVGRLLDVRMEIPAGLLASWRGC